MNNHNQYIYELYHKNPQITNEQRIDTMQKCFLKGVDLLEADVKRGDNGYVISTQEPEKLNQLNKDFQDAIDCFNNNGVGVNERTAGSVFITSVAQNRLEIAEHVIKQYPKLMDDRDLTNNAIQMVFEYTDFDSKKLSLSKANANFEESEQIYKQRLHGTDRFSEQMKIDIQKVMCDKINFIFEHSNCTLENQHTALDMSCRKSLTDVYDFAASHASSNQQFLGFEETLGYQIKNGEHYEVQPITHIVNDLITKREVNPSNIFKHVDDNGNLSPYCNWGSIVQTALNQTEHPLNKDDAQKMLNLISASSVIPNTLHEFKDNVKKCVSLGADTNALLMKERPNFLTNYTVKESDWENLRSVVSTFVENGMDVQKFSEKFNSLKYIEDDKRKIFVQEVEAVAQKTKLLQELQSINKKMLGPQDMKNFKPTREESRERGQRRI